MLTWEEAKHACKVFGWRLLDVTPHNIEKLVELSEKCHIHKPGWIRSWFGFKGGDCRAAIQFGNMTDKAVRGPTPNNPDWFSAVFSESDFVCDRVELHAFCQEEHKKHTRSTGPIEPYSTVTYVTDDVTSTRFSHTTVTRTVTLSG